MESPQRSESQTRVGNFNTYICIHKRKFSCNSFANFPLTLSTMEPDNSEKKKACGKKKIEIKKIEKKANLQVTFSKRRAGLFKKAAELCVLCGADVAILVQSPGGKMYGFGGRSSMDSIIDRYLAETSNGHGGDSSANQPSQPVANNQDESEKQYFEILKELEDEKKNIMELRGKKVDDGKGHWWEQPIDDLTLTELEEYMAALETLKDNVLKIADEKAAAAVVEATEQGKEGKADSASSSSLLIPNVKIECFGGLPVRHLESADNIDNKNDNIDIDNDDDVVSSKPLMFTKSESVK